MDYEKTYKEALELMKDCVPDENGLVHVRPCDIFPELKESEDYIVIDALISGIKLFKERGWKGIGGLECDRILAWLEKQGEQKSADKVEPKFHKGDWINGYYTNYKVLSVNNDGYVVEDVDGNKIIILFENEKFHHLWTIEDAKDGDVIYSRHNTESFEWIGIFKSLDKENKRAFFYGFWHVMSQSFRVCGNEAYVLYDDFSPATKEQRNLLFQKMHYAGYEWDAEKKELKKIEQKPADNAEPKFHKGDWVVVSTTEGDLVVQIASVEYFKDGYPSYTTTEGRWFGNGTKARLLTDKDVETITLSESKVLVNKIKYWSEEDKNRINRLIEYFEDKESFTAEDDVVYANWLKSIKDRVGCETDCTTTKELSEEDEQTIEDAEIWLDTLCDYLKDGSSECIPTVKEVISKLKSLKPQPKQEWTEDDEYYYGIIQYILNNECVGKTDKENAINWVKSLRPQNNITDEELAQAKKDAYNDALGKIEYHSGDPTFDDGWSAAIWYLKKRNIRLQSQWKPSDGQMVVLNDIIINGHLSNANERILKSLQEQLKKLREE